MSKKKINFYLIYWGIVFILILTLFGCGRKANQIEPIQLKEIGQSNQTFKQPRLLDGVFVDSNKAELIPIAVMIDNFPESRPSAGLNSASVVYEAPVEAGITRFLAIFDAGDLPEKIGPIRSARPYFIELAEEYGGLFLHAGGSPEALTKLKTERQIYNIEAIGADEKYFWRDFWRKAPFNLYISTKGIEKILENKKIANQANFESWQFGLNEFTLDPTSLEVEIKYKEPVIWRYNQKEKSYFRFLADGRPFLDEAGQQISTKNLILQKTEIKIIDEVGRRKIKLDEEGKAIIFRGGQKIEGKWKKNNGRTKFYDQLNNEVELLRGKTWVEIIP